MRSLLNSLCIRYERVDNNSYAVIYEAPANKTYDEIRIIMSVKGNSIDLVTIMRNNESVTDRQKRQYQSNKTKNIEKKRLKAISKRKW